MMSAVGTAVGLVEVLDLPNSVLPEGCCRAKRFPLEFHPQKGSHREWALVGLKNAREGQQVPSRKIVWESLVHQPAKQTKRARGVQRACDATADDSLR